MFLNSSYLRGASATSFLNFSVFYLDQCVVPRLLIVVPRLHLREERMEYPKGRATIWPEDNAQAPVTAYFTPPKTKNYPVKWLLLWQDESDIE